jgi:CheY-like chemotaxis protein
MLCITVEDRGIGFDPAELVERAKAGHVGWGLFSIRERLTLLGGRFDIDSTPGRGARFRLIAPRGRARDVVGELDVRREVAVESSAAHVGLGAPARMLRILIVDDHAGVRKVFRDLLERRSELRVIGEAANGVEAIAQAHALLPDVVLMDISMPQMDGIEATRRIRAELPFIAILGLSMQPQTEPNAIEQAGASGFFVKGTDTQCLVDRLLAMHADITSGHSVG